MNAPERIFVKWKTPEEELVGTAQLLEAFAHRRINEAHELALAVPNMTWAVQAQRACDAAGLKSSIRAGRVHVGAAAQGRLKLIELLANPENETLRAQFLQSGYSEADLNDTIERYRDAKASALVRMAGLRQFPELRHGLLHVCGDESASEMFAILQGQLDRPTMPDGVEAASIVPFTHVNDQYAQMFVLGCVEGLLPGATAAEDAKELAPTETERTAFLELGKHVTKRLYYSGFATANAQFAERAGIHFVRTKMEEGTRMAMCRPTPFFASFGHERPSTLGGQALLRKYQLN